MSQFERLLFIDRALRDKGALRTSEVARRFEVSGRQVVRDIEYLRNRLSAPLEYDPSLRAYRYTERFDGLRFADEKLLIFHALARSMALNEHYVPVASGEIIEEIESRIAPDYRAVADRVRYELTIAEPLPIDDFTSVCQALISGFRLDLVYIDRKGGRSSRAVEPERLINYSGRWYLVAWDLLRDALRTFHMSRIERLSLSRDRISSPRPAGAIDQAIESYLASGFGIFKGEATVRAIVRIRGHAAAIVARQTWHPSQTVEQGVETDGTAYSDLSLPVADWTELLGRILSFGQWAEPLEPPDLRERWKTEIAALSSRANAG